MAKKVDWDKVADAQFQAMPVDFQDDWRELREYVNKHASDPR